MPPKYKEFGTKDAAPATLKLSGSASTWKRRDLEYLGVEYHYNEFDEVNIPVGDMPSDLLNGNFRQGSSEP